MADRRVQMVTPNNDAALRLTDLCKTFRAADGRETPVLDSMTLSLKQGEMVSLLGPNGCGKSTLLRIIAGLDAPTSGELLLGNDPIAGPGAERGLMFQDANLFPWLTVRRNIEAGLVARGVLQTQRHEVQEFMQLIGLEAFADAYPHQLSGGVAQRVALARALINHPRILLLDEPLGSLDQFTRMRMQDEVLQLWQSRGTTMLLVTHDIDEAIYMSDRIVLMTPRPGRVERVLDVTLPPPRQRTGREFVDLRALILNSIQLAQSQSSR